MSLSRNSPIHLSFVAIWNYLIISIWLLLIENSGRLLGETIQRRDESRATESLRTDGRMSHDSASDAVELHWEILHR